MGWHQAKGGRTKKYDGRLHADETTRLFNRKVAPSLRLATRIGPQHTVATYTNLTSLLITKGAKGGMLGKTINVYSYGSGAAATMYRLKVKRMPGFVHDAHGVLDRRHFTTAADFDSIMTEYSQTYERFNWTARIRNGPQPGGAYYLKDVDKLGRRAYYQVKDKEGGHLEAAAALRQRPAAAHHPGGPRALQGVPARAPAQPARVHPRLGPPRGVAAAAAARGDRRGDDRARPHGEASRAAAAAAAAAGAAHRPRGARRHGPQPARRAAPAARPEQQQHQHSTRCGAL